MPPSPASSAPSAGRTRSRLLAIAVVVLVGGALNLTQPVTLPLAFALFLVALFWPLQRRLMGRIGPGAATLVTLAACLAAMALFMGALWLCVEQVADQWPQYKDQFQQLGQQASRWFSYHGLPVPEPLASGSGSGSSSGGGMALSLAERGFSLIGGFVLVIAFFALGLLEVRDFEAKLERILPSRQHDAWLEPTRRIAHDVQRYLMVRTVVGLITGTGTYVAALLIGLDFALVWGLLNFLLNYIPTLGSIIGVVPPVLFALVQFDGAGMGLAALATVGGVQLLMGNYVDPLLQGKYLALSPLVVLLSVVFWGWLWGIAGAFIGIPLTVAAVIACDEFAPTQWIATLLARRPTERDEEHDTPGEAEA
jgi:predicted PurR-regulated permease PerM